MAIGEQAITRRLLDGNEVISLPVDGIAPNPYQPRRIFQRETIEELANSIKEYGVMQPVTVRVINGSFYELVAGERRLRASKMAGLSEIPAIVVQINDRDSAIMALVENLQRENLNYFDEAEGLKCLLNDYGFTQEELARKIGKNQSTVANKLRILRLPREVQRNLLENDMTERHARALLRIPAENRETLEGVVKRMIKNGLTVKETETLIETTLAEGAGEKKAAKRPAVKSFIRDVRILKNTIEQAVKVMNSSGVSTEYDIEDRDDGCIISILVSYS